MLHAKILTQRVTSCETLHEMLKQKNRLIIIGWREANLFGLLLSSQICSNWKMKLLGLTTRR